MAKITKAKTKTAKVPHTLADELEMSIVVDAIDAQLKRDVVEHIRQLQNRIVELEEIISGQQDQRYSPFDW